MPQIKSAIRPVLEELHQGLAKLYGPRLRGLILYGSYARGEEKEGSDLDLVFILDDFDRPAIEIHRTGQLVSDLSLEYGVTIALIPVREADWKQKKSLFLSNLRREGVAVP